MMHSSIEERVSLFANMHNTREFWMKNYVLEELVMRSQKMYTRHFQHMRCFFILYTS